MGLQDRDYMKRGSEGHEPGVSFTESLENWADRLFTGGRRWPLIGLAILAVILVISIVLARHG